MYSKSFYNPARSHLLRASYCFARYLDDILDGDIVIDKSQKEYVHQLLNEIYQDEINHSDQSVILGKYVFEHVDHYAANSTLPSRELQVLIDAMLFDRERSDRKMVLSQKELDNHHLRTFLSALHVTLDVTGADYHTEEIIPLARAQGHLYTLRDLKKDISQYINNIPVEVLKSTNLSSEEYWNFDKLLNSRAFKEWKYEEFNRGIIQVTKIRHILDSNHDFYFQSTVKPLYKGLNYLTRRIQKEYKFLN